MTDAELLQSIKQLDKYPTPKPMSMRELELQIQAMENYALECAEGRMPGFSAQYTELYQELERRGGV